MNQITRQAPENAGHGSNYSSHEFNGGSLIDSSVEEGSRGQNTSAQAQTGDGQPNSAILDNFLQVQRDSMNAFLSENQNRNESHRSSIQHMIDLGYQKLLDSMENSIGRLFSSPFTAQATQLQAQIDTLAQEKDSLSLQNQGLNEDCKALQKELQEVKSKLTKALRERDEQRRLADGATLADSAKTSDDVVRSKWKQLDYNINSLAKSLSKVAVRHPTGETLVRRFSAITCDWKELFNKNDFRELLIRSYIWDLVDYQVFDGHCRAWGGDYAVGFKSTREKIIARAPLQQNDSSPTLQQGTRWLVQGSALLDYVWGFDNEAIQKLVSTEARRFQTFCQIPVIGDKADSKLRAELKTIIDDAVQLDRILMGSKAIFTVRWPDIPKGPTKSLLYCADEMEAIAWDKDLTSKSRVAFVMSPILYKRGNTDGLYYDKTMTFCKASVVCE
ncbi:hypothetical protein F66182_10134 [Fusarium sp. NRRL 66182]|nr:hypothetical protein F66182_10134 [Fusarium sp. NRRL 66182]